MSVYDLENYFPANLSDVKIFCWNHGVNIFCWNSGVTAGGSFTRNSVVFLYPRAFQSVDCGVLIPATARNLI